MYRWLACAVEGKAEAHFIRWSERGVSSKRRILDRRAARKESRLARCQVIDILQMLGESWVCSKLRCIEFGIYRFVIFGLN